MKKNVLILLLFSLNLIGLSQVNDAKQEKLNTNTAKESAQQINIPDKLNIVLPKEYFEKPKSDPLKDYFPALLTLIVGILTIIVNWLISKKLRENTSQNIERQLAESKNIKYLELKASINTKNRQDWMNQFRDAVSEYISVVVVASTNLQVNNDVVRLTITKLMELQTRLDLLLHPEREKEKEIIACYSALTALLLLEESKKTKDHADKMGKHKEKLVELSRLVLERNWQKLNNLDDMIEYKKATPF